MKRYHITVSWRCGDEHRRLAGTYVADSFDHAVEQARIAAGYPRFPGFEGYRIANHPTPTNEQDTPS